MLDTDNRTPRAATFNKLVEYLTSERNNDMEFMRAFLLTYSAFATPSRLLSKLIERYLSCGVDRCVDIMYQFRPKWVIMKI